MLVKVMTRYPYARQMRWFHRENVSVISGVWDQVMGIATPVLPRPSRMSVSVSNVLSIVWTVLLKVIVRVAWEGSTVFLEVAWRSVEMVVDLRWSVMTETGEMEMAVHLTVQWRRAIFVQEVVRYQLMFVRRSTQMLKRWVFLFSKDTLFTSVDQ